MIMLSNCLETRVGPKVVFPKSTKRLIKNYTTTVDDSVKQRESKAPKPLVVKLKTKEDFLTFFNTSDVKLN